MRGRDGRLCLGDVQRLRLFVHPSGPRCCFVILMAVYDAGAVSVCESFSIENSLCLLRCEVLQVLLDTGVFVGVEEMFKFFCVFIIN